MFREIYVPKQVNLAHLIIITFFLHVYLTPDNSRQKSSSNKEKMCDWEQTTEK